MALYKRGAYLDKAEHAIFDRDFEPGAAATNEGIYRCMGCHREVTSHQGNPLPPYQHHTHTPVQGAVRWRLIVYADHQPK